MSESVQLKKWVGPVTCIVPIVHLSWQHTNGENWTKWLFDDFRKWSVSRLVDTYTHQMKFVWKLKPLFQLIWKNNIKYIMRKFSKIRFSECILFATVCSVHSFDFASSSNKDIRTSLYGLKIHCDMIGLTREIHQT